MADAERKSFAQESDGTQNAPQVDYEAKARESGWAPQESFKGKPEKWIDAKSWVERGESFIPFLQASNRGLKEEVGSLRAQLEETRRMQNATLKAIEELKSDVGEQTVEATQKKKEELMSQIVQARADDDVAKELALKEELDEVNAELREAKKKPAVPLTDATRGTPAQTDLTGDPRFQRFLLDNPWFKDDPMMAGAAVSAMGQLNSTPEGKAMTPEERFDWVARTVKKRFGMNDNPRRQTPNRVEGGRLEGNTGGGGGEGKTFADLPPDAKQMCDSLSKRFIGKTNGKGEVKYKDLAAYRAQYVADYFAEDWGHKIQNQ